MSMRGLGEQAGAAGFVAAGFVKLREIKENTKLIEPTAAAGFVKEGEFSGNTKLFRLTVAVGFVNLRKTKENTKP